MSRYPRITPAVKAVMEAESGSFVRLLGEGQVETCESGHTAIDTRGGDRCARCGILLAPELHPDQPLHPEFKPFPGEVRVVDAKTGGEKGSKPVQFMRLLEMAPAAFLTDLGKLYEFGATKYARDNWRKGYAWSLSYNALLRHLTATLNGEWADPESGLPHVVHVAWHCATLHTFMAEGLGTDDRL